MSVGGAFGGGAGVKRLPRMDSMSMSAGGNTGVWGCLMWIDGGLVLWGREMFAMIRCGSWLNNFGCVKCGGNGID